MADNASRTAKAASEASASRPFNPDGGEDEGSASQEGDDSHMNDDQKPITGNSTGSAGNDGNDDRHKTEDLTKAGRDIDPDDGSE